MKMMICSSNISDKKSHLHLSQEYKKYIILFNLEETLENGCYVKNPKCYEDVLLLNL